jgi:chromosome partitioning protein
MGIAITVMNAKGGVGKSTLVLALAETMSTHHRKRVLVVDSDAQASISHMLMPPDRLEAAQSEGKTIVDYLVGVVLRGSTTSWRDFLVSSVSDVDDARSIDLLVSDTHLTLFEREVSKGDHESLLRRVIGACLSEARLAYDIILIDSAPGLSVLTECWLREADYYLSPTKPDYISTRGLNFLRQFRQRDPEMGFAEHLGVVINMKDEHSATDEHFERLLRRDPEFRCFAQAILRAAPLQSAANVFPHSRSYWAKYPGQSGEALRQLTSELLARISTANVGLRGAG